MNKQLILLAVIVSAIASSARARQTDSATVVQKLYSRVTPSLVVVQYTYAGEGGRRELAGTGVVVREDGLIMASMGLAPAQLPDAHMKDFKIIIPVDDQEEIDAVFLGRDERTNLIFVKPAAAQNTATQSSATAPAATAAVASSRVWTPLKFEDAPIAVGQEVYSVGVLPKDAGYKAYVTRAMVAAVLRGPVPQCLVDGGGLAAIGAPVLDETGRAIGLVGMQEDQTPLLNDPRREFAGVPVPSRMFVPSRDFLISLSDPPDGTSLKLPTAGIAQLTGLSKEVAEYYGLKHQPAVQVGDVVPGMAAEKAGIKSGDVIVKLNGQPLERGDQPDETWQIMTRKVQRMKVGDEISLTIIRDRTKPPFDLKLTLGDRPKPISRADRFHAEDLGFAVRELVFEDVYDRRLPPDSTGVVVAFIKQGASAHTARLAMNDMITQLNGQPVKSLEDFKTRFEAFRKDHSRDAVVVELMRGANTTVVRIEPPQ